VKEFAGGFGTKGSKAAKKIEDEKGALLCYYDCPAER
jgi:hypothetical protein